MLRHGWQSLSGALGLALIFIALFLPGPPPKTDDTTQQLTRALVDQRGALVYGVLLAGFGVMAMLWFVGLLADALRQSPSSWIAALGGIAGTTLLFIGMLLFAGTAFTAARLGDAPLVRSVVDTGNMVIEASKFGFAVLIAATCAANPDRQLVSPRMARVGLAVAAVLVLSTIPPFIVRHGIGQFGGGVDVVGGIPGFVWIIALSVVMSRRLADSRELTSASGRH